MTLRILIVGAGLAGLTTRIALRRHGLDADIIERRPEAAGTGTGLFLPANAVRTLRGLGLGDALEAASSEIHQQRIRDVSGRLLSGYELSSVWPGVGESRVTTHAGLHAVLDDAAGDGVRYGTAVRSARPDGGIVLEDGTEDRYDLIIGADGIGSAVRQAVSPAVVPQFLGQICWRILATSDAPPRHTWTVQLGDRGRSVLTVPLGDGRVYCFAAIDSASPEEPAGNWRDLFADFASPAMDVLNGDETAHFAPLHEITGDDWVHDRVVLIGDAAHACSPSMAQGGALAFEDATVLAELLSGAPEPDRVAESLRRYRERRSSRVGFVLEQNHRRDRARHLPALARRLVFRLGGERLVRANHAGLLPPP